MTVDEVLVFKSFQYFKSSTADSERGVWGD